MKRLTLERALGLTALGLLFANGIVTAMTIEVESGTADFVRVGDPWRYFRGRTLPGQPPGAWKEPGFADGTWEVGATGIGYGDGDDATEVLDMQQIPGTQPGYATIYARRTFPAGAPLPQEPLELVIDYDDGFIAYLNGQEVARRSMPAGAADNQTLASTHEAGTPETIPLGSAADLLEAGANVLAIEVHNTTLDSGDLSLIPALRTPSDVVRDGNAWVVAAASVVLRGTTSAATATSVNIGGVPAELNAADRTWRGAVSLSPGRNTVVIQALDAAMAPVDTGTADLIYVPPANHTGGTLTGTTVWSGAHIVDSTVTIPAGSRLAIEPGALILFKPSTALVISGELLALGTEPDPIRFTHYGDGTTWKQILFARSGESRLVHCIFEYADSEGAHQDYYGPGSRAYHEAVVVVASDVEFEGCIFQKLPGEGAAAEGDAIAVISDDPDLPGAAAARVAGCQFLRIGQGVHSRFSPVVVEGCFFTGKRGDNDDVDLWGESVPPPVVRDNIFLDPEHDDAINPTRCSAIITGNFIAGTDDHGIVLRDRGSPIVMNNVITRCANGGIAVENSCRALLVNNTIVDCGRGLRLFDLGRWDAPYFLNPGGGTATVINCIIRDCPQPITLEDSSNTTIADRGSHVTVVHCDIEGGQAAISVSGSQSTVTWGQGNIDADPLFASVAAADFHLRPGSPAIDAGTADQAPGNDRDGNPRPCGQAHDMGAHEVCASGPIDFVRGDANADGDTDISDGVATLFFLFAGGRAPVCVKSADANDDGNVNLADVLYLLGYLFTSGAAPPAPLGACGPDPTGDQLGCESFPACL